ncbi:MAG: S9 family peptidase [Verrucomicrobiaceae bacterium]|nr:MAG: S9 family peptidase [Verrucomicrobiaceae bacterium]
MSQSLRDMQSGLSLFVTVSFVSWFTLRAVNNRFPKTLNGADRSKWIQYWRERDQDEAFLQEVQGVRALDWVRAQNKHCLQRLGDPAQSAVYSKILSILDSKEKIPYPFVLGTFVFNFWQDEQNPRGVLRRTSMTQFLRRAQQQRMKDTEEEEIWTVVLDIDELNKREGESWVYKGLVYCDTEDVKDTPENDEDTPEDTQSFQRCLLKLSRGGSDALVCREFDLRSFSFVTEDAFFIPEGKSYVSWRDKDTLFVGADLGSDSLTESGYPRTVRLLARRGTLFAAPILERHLKIRIDHLGSASRSQRQRIEAGGGGNSPQQHGSSRRAARP